MRAVTIRLLASILFLGTFSVQAQSTHTIYFEGSDYELHTYHIQGRNPGKTLLIIGGIQGDEPGGYLSADLYSQMTLESGNLIIVPRANFKSIILGQRGPDGDMNRQFHDNPAPGPMSDVVSQLKKLIGQADVFLHLHDGWGFHRPEYIDDLRNPSRYGQSLIADTEVFTCSNGSQIPLGEIARDVLRNVNARITRADHHLHYFNTKTDEPNTQHSAMRKTATFYALRRHCIPAYGIEASKNLPSLELKVFYHNLVIKEFMDRLGIVPINPKVFFQPPRLEFAHIEVNGKKTIVQDGEVLNLKKGDRIKIHKIAANGARGLSCDLVGHGDLNDLGQSFTLHQGTQLIFRKEGQVIGKVALQMGENAGKQRYVAGRTRVFVVEVNNQQSLVIAGQTLNLTPADQIVIRSSFSDGNNTLSPEINFKGWVPPGVPNIGDDRNYVIRLTDHLQKKFSVHSKGDIYPVVAETPNGKKLGEIYIQLQ